MVVLKAYQFLSNCLINVQKIVLNGIDSYNFVSKIKIPKKICDQLRMDNSGGGNGYYESGNVNKVLRLTLRIHHATPIKTNYSSDKMRVENHASVNWVCMEKSSTNIQVFISCF